MSRRLGQLEVQCAAFNPYGPDGKERIAGHVKRACLVLARSPAEDVGGRPDDDIGEAGVFERFPPARTGQPARDSSCPQVDVAQCLR